MFGKQTAGSARIKYKGSSASIQQGIDMKEQIVQFSSSIAVSRQRCYAGYMTGEV